MTQSTWWTCIDHTNGLLPVGAILMATTPYLEVMGEYGYGVLNETTREDARKLAEKTGFVTATCYKGYDKNAKPYYRVEDVNDYNEYILIAYRSSGAAVGLPSFVYFKRPNVVDDLHGSNVININSVVTDNNLMTLNEVIVVAGQSIRYDACRGLKRVYGVAHTLLQRHPEYTAVGIVHRKRVKFDRIKNGQLRVVPQYILHNDQLSLSRVLHPLVGNNVWGSRSLAENFVLLNGLNDSRVVIHHNQANKDLDVFRMENVDKAYRVCVTTPRKKFNSKKDEESFDLF